MVNPFRRFFESLGLVEQSQVVTSTAVVVAMTTIVSVHFVTGHTLAWMDFVSITTMGLFGYITVYFSLKYGRQLENQRKELFTLNTIAEAVSHSVELNYVLQSALIKVMELMRADFGWIYLLENQSLSLKHYYGTSAKFFAPDATVNDSVLGWVRKPSIHRADDARIELSTTMEFKVEGIQILASIPLERQGAFAGVLIIASKESRRFASHKIELIQAFGNQISVALQNASLFDQIRKSEQLYADLFENSPDMYHSVNRNGTIVSCNMTESQVLGYPKEDLIGRPLIKLYPASQHEHVREDLRRIFERNEELRGVEEQIQKSDGALIDVSVNTSLVYDGEGRAKLARMVLRDITDQKRMEAKILEAQKIDSIGNLAGGIAHDFNNILTSVLGSASMMRRKIKDEPRWVKYVDLIETASRRGASLTRQLLTFARKHNPNVRLADVNGIIEETVRLFEASAPKSIHISLHLSEDPVVIQADEGQMQQAILNLCLNSRDAMPKGGVLSIHSKVVHLSDNEVKHMGGDRPGDYVAVSVIDSGQGIPKEILHRVFEPFFTTKEQGKGTGLGLSVVYGIVRSHNGYVNVESEVDSGTAITFFLPRVMDAASRNRAQRAVPDATGGTEHILMIEDEASVSEVGADILQDLGYSVEIARNGREAVEKLSAMSRAFDLVILDMNMPRMGGREAFEFIRERYPRLKVLVCSGYSATMLDDGQFVKSIDGFIQKPYEIEDFAHKIREVIASNRN